MAPSWTASTPTRGPSGAKSGRRSSEASRSPSLGNPTLPRPAGLMVQADPTLPRRGELWWVVLDPVLGHELGGHAPGEPRPALVVSADEMAATGKLIVVPGTSRERPGLPRIPFSWRLGARMGTTYLCGDDLRAVAI